MIPTKEQFSEHVMSLNDEEFPQLLYSQHLMSAFMAIINLESIIINTMTMCDSIKISSALGSDSKAWNLIAKRKILQESTLGSLIKILERHDFPQKHIFYLKWVKDKRDYFVHKHFQQTPWPGELNSAGCLAMIRRMIALEIVMDRAAMKILSIFKDLGFLEIDDLGSNGFLISNPSLWSEDFNVLAEDT